MGAYLPSGCPTPASVSQQPASDALADDNGSLCIQPFHRGGPKEFSARLFLDTFAASSDDPGPPHHQRHTDPPQRICLRHFLSLALGIVLGVGEVAAVLYVLHLWGTIHLGVAGPWLQFFVLTVLYCSFLLLSFILYFIFLQFLPHTMRFNYVIIHGCGLSGGERLTRLLRDRVEKAIEIYNRCETKPVIIPSGGQGKNEKISEARAMQDYLLSRGIPAEHVIPEDRSASTAENLRFSKAIIDARGGEKRIALVSSGFHIYRCLRIAHQQGMKCTGFGSYTALYFLPSALIREFIAIFLNKTFLVWALLGYCCFLTPFLMAAFR